jgi:hypothetical protein
MLDSHAQWRKTANTWSIVYPPRLLLMMFRAKNHYFWGLRGRWNMSYFAAGITDAAIWIKN